MTLVKCDTSIECEFMSNILCKSTDLAAATDSAA